jgi:hypothetical protein
VPLARIKELLATDPARFSAAIAEIDRNLQERARELRRTRELAGRTATALRQLGVRVLTAPTRVALTQTTLS